jgi:hypothetical protein
MLPSGPAVIHCGSELAAGTGNSANAPELVPEPLDPELLVVPLEPEPDPVEPLPELEPEPAPDPEPLADPLLPPELPQPEPAHASLPASPVGRKPSRPSTRSHAAAKAAHARKAAAALHGRSVLPDVSNLPPGPIIGGSLARTRFDRAAKKLRHAAG